jgi:hypothetical protein
VRGNIPLRVNDLDRQPQLRLDGPLSIVEIVATALRLFARHPAAFGLLALAVVAPYELIVLAITGTAPLGQQNAKPGTVFTLLLIDAAFVGPLISALYVQAVVVIGGGERLRMLEVVIRGARVLPVVAAAQIVAGIGIAIGLIAFIVPGVILSIRWAVVAQAAAVERTDWLGALRRSGQLAKENYLHVFALTLLVTAVNVVLSLAGESITGSSRAAGAVILGIAVQTIVRSFAALATAILYFDLLARHRGR